MAEYTDPYETWKEQGRPGGNYQSWLSQRSTGQAAQPSAPSAVPAAPAAPAPFPAPPPAAPAAPSGAPAFSGLGRSPFAPVSYPAPPSAPRPTPNVPAVPAAPAAGGAFSAAPGATQQQIDAIQRAGTWGDDSPDAGTMTGDPYLDELRSGKFAGSEDWRRFSNAQLKAWQSYYIGNGKFRNKWGDVVDKPDDTGPNTPPGYNGTGDPMGGGGGGGGGAGSGAGGGGGGGLPSDVSSQADTLWDKIMNLQSRYSPEIIQKLMADAKRRGSAAGTSAREQAELDYIRRGMGRSSAAANAALTAARGAEASVVNPMSSTIAAEKVRADQEDRIAQLQAMQNWINSARAHIQGMRATQVQKEVAMANLDLAEKRLQQELVMQQNQFDYGFAMNANQQFA